MGLRRRFLVPHQVGYAAVEEVCAFDVALPGLVVPVADERDFEALVEVGGVLQVLDDVVEVVVDLVEDIRVGTEAYGGAVGPCGPLADQFGLRDAPDVLLGVAEPLTVDLGPHRYWERALTTEAPTPWSPPDTL